MSSRRILNLTSTKKHDNMAPLTRNPSGVVEEGGINFSTSFASLYVPTARKYSTSPGAGEANRQRQLTYSVGYKEKLMISIRGSGSFTWRRIVFRVKGGDFLRGLDNTNVPWLDATADPKSGNMRRVIQLLPDAAYINARDILFDGQEGVDWTNQLTAKVDTSRVSVMSDRTRNYSPKNESGLNVNHNLWYPTRKNLLYNDDENGADSNNQGSYLSATGPAGMGDMYIYDFMLNTIPDSANQQQCVFRPEGIYYWHEK